MGRGASLDSHRSCEGAEVCSEWGGAVCPLPWTVYSWLPALFRAAYRVSFVGSTYWILRFSLPHFKPFRHYSWITRVTHSCFLQQCLTILLPHCLFHPINFFFTVCLLGLIQLILPRQTLLALNGRLWFLEWFRENIQSVAVVSVAECWY